LIHFYKRKFFVTKIQKLNTDILVFSLTLCHVIATPPVTK